MPSLWKKHQKGNRISRLVSDIQTTPKKGGSLVVETGFPTSLVDLFHKNRDKLKKPSKKKLRFKEHNSTTTEDQPFRLSQSVSHPDVSVSNSELPISSIDDDENQKPSIVEFINNDMFIEENDEYYVELNDNVDPGKDEYKGVIYSRIVFWLCVFMGTFIVGVALYNKRFVWGISLGGLLMVLLDCVGNKVFRVFKCREGVLLLSILKGALIVIVAMYSHRFVVGVTMEAIMLFLFEYVGKKLVFRLFKPCDNDKDQWEVWDRVIKKRVVEEKLGRGNGTGGLSQRVDSESKIVVEKGSGNGVIKSEIEQEYANGGAVMRENELEVEHNRALIEEEKGSSLKGETGHIDGEFAILNGNNHLNEEEKQKPIICEINAIDPKCSDWQRQPGVCGPDGYCEMPGKKGKVKKGKAKKFWKKLVPKHIRKKKKNKRGKENHEAENDSVQSSATELEEDDEDHEMACMEESSTSTSSDDEEVVVSKYPSTTTLPADKGDYTSYKIVSVKDRNFKCLALLVIPLAGLVRGRMFSLILTLICCVVFKMFKMIRC